MHRLDRPLRAEHWVTIESNGQKWKNPPVAP
jgi:hypothetical protein